jgi:hypothetical protein
MDVPVHVMDAVDVVQPVKEIVLGHVLEAARVLVLKIARRVALLAQVLTYNIKRRLNKEIKYESCRINYI